MVDQFFLRLFTFAGIAVICWVIYLLKPVVIPFFIALMLAYLLNPLVEQLCKFKCSRAFSITLVFTIFTLLMTLAVWYIIPMLWKQMIFVRDNIPAGIAWVNNVLFPWIAKTFNVDTMILDTEQFATIIMTYVQTNYNADSIQTALLQVIRSGINVLQLGGSAVLIPIITFYFLLDWQNMLQRIQTLIPVRFEYKTLQIIRECDHVLKAFIKGQLLVMFLLGTIYATGLEIIGLEVGLMLGMMAGLASIIPYAGFALGIICALFASFFQFGLDWMQFFLVLIVFSIGQLCEGYILQPFLLGDKIGLSPVAVVFAVLAGAQLAGFAGMLLALPVAAIIVVLLHHCKEYYQQSEWFQRDANPSTATLIDYAPIEQTVNSDKTHISTELDDDTITPSPNATKETHTEDNQ